MQIRDNVRERRRERIEQLIGQHAIEEARKRSESSVEEVYSSVGTAEGASRMDNVSTESSIFDPVPPSIPVKPEQSRFDMNPKSNTRESAENADPELWWREREKRLKSGQAAGWQGLKGIPPASSARIDPPTHGFEWNKLIHGFSLRLVFSIIAFAGLWGWFKLEMPGTKEARDWMVNSVTRDMDFQAIEAWYGDTFGGSPTFFSFNRNEEPDTKEVLSALLKPEETVIPVQGTIVQSYDQNGTGVKIAADGGSDVFAIYTGRVQQVTTDQDGGVTVLVQHLNQILTVYGNLGKSSVKPNDWVQTGQLLGQLNISGSGEGEGVLYFAVQQNGKKLNPADVVSFD